jgi:hypothetical protein
MAIRRVGTLGMMLVWLAADAALLSAVVLDWWGSAQYLATTSPGFWRGPAPAEQRAPDVLPRVVPSLPVMARLK